MRLNTSLAISAVFRYGLSLLAVFLSALLMMKTPNLLAAEPVGQVEEKLAHVQSTTVSARVVIRRDLFSTPIPTSAEHILERGCHYDIRDVAELAALLALIANADIQQAEPGGLPVDARSVIDLSDSSGRVTRLVFAAMGERIRGTVDGVQVHAGSLYHTSLERWASERRPTSAPDWEPCP